MTLTSERLMKRLDVFIIFLDELDAVNLGNALCPIMLVRFFLIFWWYD